MTDDIKALVARLREQAWQRSGAPKMDAGHVRMLEWEAADALTRMQGVLAETVPDPEYRRMQDIEIERLRDMLEGCRTAHRSAAQNWLKTEAEAVRILAAWDINSLPNNYDLLAICNDRIADLQKYMNRAEEAERQRDELREKYRVMKEETEFLAGIYGDEIERLREALIEAREDIVHWAGYASDYFKDKHDYVGDLARIDAALEAKP